jgi:hypothetical protein
MDPSAEPSTVAEDPVAALRSELAALRADHQTKLDSLSIENASLKERIQALEVKKEEEKKKKTKKEEDGEEPFFQVAELEVDNKKKADPISLVLQKRPLRLESRFDNRFRFFVTLKRKIGKAVFEPEEIEEHECRHELSESMWDACLFLGCKDETNGEKSMNVGFAVTIFGLIALLINALIQAAIVAVVVRKMANNPDIDEGTAADMRCASRRSCSPQSPSPSPRNDGARRV